MPRARTASPTRFPGAGRPHGHRRHHDHGGQRPAGRWRRRLLDRRGRHDRLRCPHDDSDLDGTNPMTISDPGSPAHGTTASSGRRDPIHPDLNYTAPIVHLHDHRRGTGGHGHRDRQRHDRSGQRRPHRRRRRIRGRGGRASNAPARPGRRHRPRWGHTDDLGQDQWFEGRRRHHRWWDRSDIPAECQRVRRRTPSPTRSPTATRRHGHRHRRHRRRQRSAECRERPVHVRPTGRRPQIPAVFANDSDPDGDTLTIIAKTDGAHGTVDDHRLRDRTDLQPGWALQGH